MTEQEKREFHKNCLVVDLHCHPSIKMHIYDAQFKERNNSNHPQRSTGFDPLTFQVTFPKMEIGKIDIIFSSVYLPENGFKNFSNTVCITNIILQALFPEIMQSIEKEGDKNLAYQQTIQILQRFEKEVNLVNDNEQSKVTIPKNLEEFEIAISENKKIVLHTIEGAHSLGRFIDNENGISEEEVIEEMKNRIDSLLNLGVCLMTIGHFFRNDLTESCKGFPPSMDLLLFDYNYDENKGLTKIGEEVVKYMLEKGMIVDLVHCSRKARQQIFDLNNNKRPLTFSHCGSSELTKLRDRKEILLNITDEEIHQIHECNGTIGIIMNNYLLTGIEDELGSSSRKGIYSILRTVKHIKDITNSYDNISIGTDFDGFTDPPDDFPDIIDMPQITAALLDKGIPEEAVKKIMGLNAIRLLRKGWR